jgi:hypothetical protein
MPPTPRLRSFTEFWPFYLGQHSKRRTRDLHFVGTNVAVVAVVVALFRRELRLIPLGLALAYALAWVGHFFVERNRPATFSYPLWSFAADCKMWALTWTGRLDAELRRHGIDDR